jgi:hypothetical protein
MSSLYAVRRHMLTWLPSAHEMAWFTGGWFTGILTGLLVALIAVHLSKRM